MGGWVGGWGGVLHQGAHRLILVGDRFQTSVSTKPLFGLVSVSVSCLDLHLVIMQQHVCCHPRQHRVLMA